MFAQTSPLWALTTWNTTTGSWDDPANWSAGRPAADVDFSIDNGGSATLSTTAAARLGVLGSLAGQSGALSIQSGGTLTVTQIVKGGDSASLTLNGGVLRAASDQGDFLQNFGTGDVVLATDSSFDTAGYSIGVSAPISGSGMLTKQGEGTLTLSGANTFTGGFGVLGGTLAIATSAAAGNSRYLGDAGYAEGAGSTVQVNAGVTLTKNIGLWDGATLDNRGSISSVLGGVNVVGGGTVINTGTLTALSGYAGDGVYVQDGFASVINTGGTITAVQGNGIWMKAGGSVVNQTAGTISTSGSGLAGIRIEGTSGTVQNLTGSTITGRGNGITLSKGGSVTNSGGSTIQTTGSGGQNGISGASGLVTIENLDTSLISGRQRGVSLSGGGSVLNEGTITGAQTTGSTNAGVYFSSVAAALVNKGTINGGVIMSNHAHSATLHTGSVINGVLNMGTSTAATLTLAGTGNQLYSQAVTGTTTFSGSLTKTGSGTWTLDKTFTSTRPVTISEGTLRIGNGATSGSVAGDIVNNSALVFDRSDNIGFAGAISGVGSLTKTGAGVTTLTKANTYTGSTNILTGTLALGAGGSLANTGHITVASGAIFDVRDATGGFTLGAAQTLSGGGTIFGNTTIAGTLAPGASAGLLTFDGDLVLDATATLNFELGGFDCGTGYDAIDVTGNLTYGGALVLLMADGFTLSEGNTFQLFSIGGMATGAFASVSFANPGWTGVLDYDTGWLTISAVPEPASSATLAAISGLACAAMRRRRRA